jgi:hypothetical protein
LHFSIWDTNTGDEREQIVRRDVEEALDLAGMQFQRQYAVRAGGGDQVGHQLSRDRRARAGLAVLAGIAEIGDDGGDPARRAAAQGIDDHQQFHQIVVRGKTGRLDDENILTAHVFKDLDKDLLVRKTPDCRFGQGHAKLGGNSL